MIVAPPAQDLLASLREENLNVYRASPQRLREDVGQENQIAQDYRGRLIYELLQNADDAMATEDPGVACIRFVLTDDALWVGNSGRPLDEADVRGLCGISASSKLGRSQQRRATIGHKGMGFKSVLEITEAPEVYSTTISFRFGPSEALRAVGALVDAGVVAPVTRAPVTRFPWPVDRTPPEWAEMCASGMRTAFRFPLRPSMTAEQRARLADALINLPVTTLVFLKHFHRVEFAVRRGGERLDTAWTVAREHLVEPGGKLLGGFQTGLYRVALSPDRGDPVEFLLAHDGDLAIGEHRGGLDDFSWEGVEYTEVSVAARLKGERPVPLAPDWRRLHVFLPSDEPCPYNLLVSGAFSANLSRQEIRIERDTRNYNRFLLRQAARLVRDRLVPSLLQQGASVGEVLRLLDRGQAAGGPAGTGAVQALYEEVRAALQGLPFILREVGEPVAPADCIVPPLVGDVDLGRDFRAVLPADAAHGGRSFPAPDLCGADTARILVDHGAHALGPTDAAAVLASADAERSRLWEDLERCVAVDPVLSVLERLWEGLDPSGRGEFAGAVRRQPLCPVGIGAERGAHRIATEHIECFYPPRSLSGEVPLDGLCFLARDLCWGALTARERNTVLRRQMDAWQALFGVREFKFPDVMRASVLPALELERSTDGARTRAALHEMDRLAAICQLAGRTPNRNAPLPYERLGSNRALFNLSRLDVPCRKRDDDRILWMPAYRVYFGDDWIGDSSIDWVLLTGDIVVEAMPDIYLLPGPNEFIGLLSRYRHLEGVGMGDDGEFGEDEVGLDEDEEAALDADDRTRWFEFFSWLGVNTSLRPVHFHDVEDRATGWLRTEGLQRPEGWAFHNVPETTWQRFVGDVLRTLREKDPGRFETTAPYFYRLHDLEHLVVLLEAAARDETAQLGKALYAHLARNWGSLERFARLQVAQVQRDRSPALRTKPPRVYDQELVYAGDDFWLRRLQEAWFCPTGHGPRPASRVWLPTLEVQRRFGNRTRHYLLPTLDVDPGLTRAKGRAFAQALGMREELTPANFTVDDARVILERLKMLYADRCAAGADLRADLREIIRPAYRNLLELLSSRERPDESRGPTQPPLADAPLLAQDRNADLRFAPAREVFYSDRRETRDRLRSDEGIPTFVIEASPVARAPLAQMFGMRTLEEAMQWTPTPGDPALSGEDVTRFRAGLWDVAPYLLARLGADRADERLARQDLRRLRRFVEVVEPVTHLALACALDGRPLAIAADQRLAYVELDDDGPAQAFLVWGEHPWPPAEDEAEALATALCEVLGAGYFESFLALIQAGSAGARERLLRRAGAPRDVDEKRALLQQGDAPGNETPVGDKDTEVKTAAPTGPAEAPASPPGFGAGAPAQDGPVRRTPLFSLDELVIDGQPVRLVGTGNPLPPHGKGRPGQDAAQAGPRRTLGYGGHTDLSTLDRLGMGIALAYERNRLRKAGLAAEILDPSVDDMQPEAIIFDVSSPTLIEKARALSPQFDAVMRRLQQEFAVSPEWPGFDILSLDPRREKPLDRLIELKSSGVDARMQELSWNEWNVATSGLRPHFFLYLVGNLRSDLKGSVPFVRTVHDPLGQLEADVRRDRGAPRKVHLAVHLFKEAEHLDLTVVGPEPTPATNGE